MTRQRLYQLRHRIAGLCQICPRPVDRGAYCALHYPREAVRARENQRRYYGRAARYDGPPRRQEHPHRLLQSRAT